MIIIKMFCVLCSVFKRILSNGLIGWIPAYSHYRGSWMQSGGESANRSTMSFKQSIGILSGEE